MLVPGASEVYLIEADVRVIRVHFEKMKGSMNEIFMWFILISLEDLHVKFLWLVSCCLLAGCSDDLLDQIPSGMIFIDYDASVVLMGKRNKDSSLTHVPLSPIVDSVEQVDIVTAYAELSLHVLDDCIVKTMPTGVPL